MNNELGEVIKCVMKGKKIIFVSYWPNAIIPIYEAMKEQNYNVHLMEPTPYPSVTKKLQLKRGYKVLSRADLYVVAQRVRWLTPLDKTFLMIHGIGLEEALNSDSQYKRVFVTGPKWMTEYKKVFSEQDWDKLMPVGFPPLERLLSADVRRKAEKIRDQLSLEGRSTILCGILLDSTPMQVHHISNVLIELAKVIHKLDVNLIVKPHQYIQRWGWRKKRYYNKEYEDLKSRLSLRPNIHIISPDEDILPYYHISDVLCTSRCSSIITEFMTLDKPTVQIVTPNSYPITIDEPSNKGDFTEIDKLQNTKNLDQYPMPFFPVGLRCEIDNIFETVKRSILNLSEYSGERKSWIEQSIYSPIGTIDRAIQEIAKTL